MSPRQMRQLDRLREALDRDPLLTPEDKGRIIHNFASGCDPPISPQEIDDYLNNHKIPLPTTSARADTAEAALERHRALAGFMAGQPPS